MPYLDDADDRLLASSGRRAQALALARPQQAAPDPLQQLMGCPPPVWENQDRSKLTDGGCVIFSGTARCKGSAGHRAWIGCTIGEHLDHSDVCEAHAAMLAKDATAYNCRRCWDATGQVSKAKVIKIERLDDDDEGPAAPPGRLAG
jgi:hypothetical protein